jgi:hypothetical protein
LDTENTEKSENTEKARIEKMPIEFLGVLPVFSVFSVVQDFELMPP